MASKKSLVVSTIGILVLFIGFLLYGSAQNVHWGSLKLSDVLTIIGGLLFIVPFYAVSVAMKKRNHVPNNWIWEGLPVVGMILVVVGILIPNSVGLFPLLSLPDIMYLIGCILMLLIFVYPPQTVNEEILEEDAKEMADNDK
ncbi:hypothetical protein [Bifidobacterium magnum]|uniref:Permease n=1 Tax=Bifidobacterium magnum TaxID=1692 RepID=A0A087BC20_9BIFI|nr:hypothetical protein [Bifidobacterium magnum]KFI68570.1 hypothetical protein BMAGN_0437 [Bifidobacterium magnum]